MGTRQAVAAALLGMLALGACGGARQLRTAGEAESFIATIAKGGKTSEWKLGSNADVLAQHAWRNRTTIQALGKKLRDDGAEWACNVVEQVEHAPKVFSALHPSEISQRDRMRIVLGVNGKPTAPNSNDVTSVIDKAVSLTDSELIKLIATLCSTGKQL